MTTTRARRRGGRRRGRAAAFLRGAKYIEAPRSNVFGPACGASWPTPSPRASRWRGTGARACPSGIRCPRWIAFRRSSAGCMPECDGCGRATEAWPRVAASEVTSGLICREAGRSLAVTIQLGGMRLRRRIRQARPIHLNRWLGLKPEVEERGDDATEDPREPATPHAGRDASAGSATRLAAPSRHRWHGGIGSW